MSPQIFGEKIQALKAGLDFATVKNRAITANIANIETPGFKRFKVILDEKLTAGKTGSASDSTGKSFKIVRDETGTMRADGNNVDIDRELAEMNANAIYFTALGRFLAKNFTGLHSVISEGRR